MGSTANKSVKLRLEAENLSGKPFSEVNVALDVLSSKLDTQAAAAAKNEATTRELNTTLNKLKDVQQALANGFALAENYKRLAEATSAASAKAQEAASRLASLKSAQDGAANATKKAARELNQAQTAADRAQKSYETLKGRLEETGSQLVAIGANVEELAAFQSQLVAANTRVNESYAKGATALENYDANIRAHRESLKAAASAAKDAQAASATREAEAASIEQAEADRAARREKGIRDRIAVERSAQAAQEQAYDAVARRELAEAQAEREQVKQADAVSRAAREDALAQQLAVQLAQEQRDAQEKLNKEIAEDARLKLADKKATDELIASMQKALGLTEAQIATANKQKRVTPENAESGTGTGGRGRGLSETQIENLGYRVKDVIDQLGSGSSVARVVAQQGAATLAIFEKQIGSLITLLPQLALGAAALITVGVAAYRLAESAGALREYNALLKLSVDGANYQAEALLKDQRSLQAMGASFKDAGDAVKTFIDAGIKSDKIEEFGKVSEGLVRVFGVALPDAAKEVTAAFTSNYAAVQALDQKYNFLTVAQNDQVRAMFLAGKVTEAQTLAFDLFRKSVDGVAGAVKGPFYDAFLSARNAFNSFLDLLNNSGVIKRVADDIKLLADDAKYLTDKLNNLGADPSSKDQENAIKGQIGSDKDQIASIKKSGAGNSAEGSAVILKLQEDIRKNEVELERLIRARGDTAADAAKKEQEGLRATTQAQEKAFKVYRDEQKLRDEAEIRNNIGAKAELARRDAESSAAAQHIYSDAQIAQIGADAKNRVYEQAALVERRREEGLEGELASLTKQGDNSFKDSLKDRLAAVDETYSKIALKIQDLERFGKTDVLGTPIAEFKAQVAAQEEIVKNQITQKYYEDELKALDDARSTKLKEIIEDVKTGALTAQQGYAQSVQQTAKLRPQMEALASAALKFGEAMQKAHPGPQIDAFVSRAQRALSDNKAPGKGQPEAAEADGEKELNAEIERGNQIIQARADLQKAYEELVKKGVLTTEESENKLKAYYASTDSSLRQVIADATALAAALSKIGGDTTKLDLYIAKLKGIQADTQYVSKSSEDMAKQIKTAFADDLVKSVNSAAEAFGKFVAGQEKLKDAIRQAGVALAGFVADFLKSIAEIILKKEALVVVDLILKALGDPGGAGGGVEGSSGGGDSGGDSSIFHTGGVVGAVNNTTRKAEPAWFRNAPKYHSGGVVGLAPNERAIIAKDGEEMLTADDPRNVLNGGKGRAGTAPAINMRHVLVMDPSVIPEAMKGTAGEQVTLSHIKGNIATLRQMLQIGNRR